jgi:hypothetical protein
MSQLLLLTGYFKAIVGPVRQVERMEDGKPAM